MTKKQQDACETLARKRHDDVYTVNGPMFTAYHFEQSYIDGYQAAQSPNQLLLNPLVKGLVEALTNSTIRYDRMEMIRALAPFQKGYCCSGCPDCDPRPSLMDGLEDLGL